MEINIRGRRRSIITPIDREIMEAIIKATCQFYEISEEELKFLSKSNEATAIRRQCFWLIKQNTNISIEHISVRLEITHPAVSRGNSIIDVHRKIYAQTRHALKAIATIANNFEKKHQWVIQ